MFLKEVLLEIPQKSQENSCATVCFYSSNQTKFVLSINKFLLLAELVELIFFVRLQLILTLFFIENFI